MLRNVVDLTEVLTDLQESGLRFTREQSTRLTPYMTAHLKPFGQHVLDMDNEPPPLKPKPRNLSEETPLR